MAVNMTLLTLLLIDHLAAAALLLMGDRHCQLISPAEQQSHCILLHQSTDGTDRWTDTQYAM